MQDSIFETPPFQRIFDQIQNLVPFTHAAVFFMEGSEVTLIAYRGPMPLDQLQPINFDLSSSKILNTIHSTGEPLLIKDMESDHFIGITTRQQMERIPDHPFSYIRSYMGFPLYSDERIYGFLDVTHDERAAYGDKDVERLCEYIGKSVDKIEIATLLSVRARSTSENGALTEIDQAILTNLNLAETLTLILTKIYQLIPAQLVEIYLSDEALSVITDTSEMPSNIYSVSTPCELSPIIDYVLSSGEMFRITDVLNPPSGHDFNYRELGARSLLFMPVKTIDQKFGVIAARDKVHGAYSPADERILKVLADRTGIVVNNAILYQHERDRRRISEELVRMQEQQRIAQALHDSVAQLLFRLGLEVKACEQHARLDDVETERFRNIQRLIARSDEELRSAIFALKNNDFHTQPSQIESLEKLVKEFQDETGIETTLVIPPELGVIPFEMMDAVARIIKESLSNIQKHSGAKGTLISISHSNTTLTVTIQDNGRGLSEGQGGEDGARKIHFGIDMMRRQVAKFGGNLSIGENDDRGVIVKAVIPLITEGDL